MNNQQWEDSSQPSELGKWVQLLEELSKRLTAIEASISVCENGTSILLEMNAKTLEIINERLQIRGEDTEVRLPVTIPAYTKEEQKLADEREIFTGAAQYSSDEVKTYTGSYKRAAEKTFYFLTDDEEMQGRWFPKSQCTVTQDTLVVPIWLVTRKLEEEPVEYKPRHAFDKTETKEKELPF